MFLQALNDMFGPFFMLIFGGGMEERYMRRALELAMRGIGKVNPNPLVGAVIVKNKNIVAEGWHAEYGGLHAERHALSRLADADGARGADMYVTLEPCCHYGKQPPCTEAIIEHGIKNVYIGSRDPNPLVSGKGAGQLEAAGVRVYRDVLKDECDAINPVFFHYITTGTPYVVMKYAMTLDGKTACDSGESRWITGSAAREHVQKTRNALAGIMAGVGTVAKDDPMLTCRLDGGRNPVRIICDSKLRIPDGCKIMNTARQIKTIIATASDDEKRILDLKKRGVSIVRTKPLDGMVDLAGLMKELGGLGIDGILLEGGGTLNCGALKAGIVSHIQAYVAPKIFGGSRHTPVGGEGVGFPKDAFMCKNMRHKFLGDDILLECDVA